MIGPQAVTLIKIT